MTAKRTYSARLVSETLNDGAVAYRQVIAHNGGEFVIIPTVAAATEAQQGRETVDRLIDELRPVVQEARIDALDDAVNDLVVSLRFEAIACMVAAAQAMIDISLGVMILPARDDDGEE